MPLGYIYKLESSFEDPGIYVGSTGDLNKRKIDHKVRCNNPNNHGYNYKLYKYIRDYGGFNNWFMLTLEEFEYEDKQQLREREQYWIKELGAYLNDRDAIIDINYNKKYKKENKQKINENFDCECGGKYTHKNKSQHLNTKKHQSYISSKVI